MKREPEDGFPCHFVLAPSFSEGLKERVATEARVQPQGPGGPLRSPAINHSPIANPSES